MLPARWACESLPRTGPTCVTAGPCSTCWATGDVLLGLDDPDLYNSKTAKNLLLSSWAAGRWR